MPLRSSRRRGRGRRIRAKVFAGLCALVVALGLAKLYGPLATIRKQSDRLAELGVKKAELFSEQTELERYKRQAATEAGQETAARRQGYLRPGERRIVFFRERARQEKGEQEEGGSPGS